MLNLDLIDELYGGLSKGQQQELIGRLFKKSKQSMGYFRRTKDISLSKLETLADFFGMPLDALRLAEGRGGSATGSMAPHLLLQENKTLRKEIENMRETLRAKDQTIEAKTEVIVTLRQQLAQEA